MAKPAKTLENVFSKPLTLCFSSNTIWGFFLFLILPSLLSPLLLLFVMDLKNGNYSLSFYWLKPCAY